MRRILDLAEELSGQCRVCWSRREVGRAHYTYRCHTQILSGEGWKAFKMLTRFPNATVCYLCFAPYASPFNHEIPSKGAKHKGELCEYPDALKELTYIVYQDNALRNSVFTRLHHVMPATLASYWRFLGKKQASGLFGVYEVLAAYLDVRESIDSIQSA
jgi:hypothetical protein